MLESAPFMNPYHHLTFFSFILQFFQRLFLFMTGQLSWQYLASDEIQVLVLMGVSISSALVGTFLVLRRMTMLANSLSHTILIGIVLAYLSTYFFNSSEAGTSSLPPMQLMLLAALLTGFLTAFLTEFLIKTVKIQEDASTGLVFTSLFAIGVILVTVLTRDAHIGTEAVMGNADALHLQDLFWVYVITLFNIVLFTVFYKEFKITTFDPYFAYALGFSPFIFNYILMAQVSVTTITSFRAVGVLLVLAFMTGPVLAARLLTHRLNRTLILAVGLGGMSCLIGVALTRHILTVYGVALSTSGVVVCSIAALYFLIIVLASKYSPLLKWRFQIQK